MLLKIQFSTQKLKLTFMMGILIFSISNIIAGETFQYKYDINLKDIHKKQFKVELNCADFAQDTLIYHFPWIIPGTYAEANYGKYIHKLTAFDQKGDQLKVKKQGKNTFIITPANQIQTIKYWVSASWDSRRAIWPMAGTGIVPDRAFAINAGGVFGYFQGQERQPVDMIYTYPEHLYAMTVLDQTQLAPGEVSISTMDYHELVDSPILFGYPDTSSFKVHETDVMVGFAHETDDTRRAAEITAALQPSMEAIGAYLDSLPADEYAFLVYYSDEQAMGKILDNPRFFIAKSLLYVIKHGIPMGGALEHNKSSFYYLPDPGSKHTERITETIESIAIHEFMHILTPLNLRSQYIHDWDYNDPIMSKHLWLYEGVTEYMSQIIQVNGGLKTPKEFLLGTMQSKLRSGERYPFEEVSFTEMSASVLEKGNQKIYTQVYQRGAVMAMLLDIEIMRLTQGEKRLIDVMLELIHDYGPERPMDEATIFEDFTAKVHPDLMLFFTRYVEGHEPLPYAEVFNQVGVVYRADTLIQVPKHPIRDTKVKQSTISLGRKITIKKAGRQNVIGLKAGDKLDRKFYHENYFDEFGKVLPEETVISLIVERDKQDITLSDTIRYKEDTVKHYMQILEEMTPEQSHYYNLWLGIDSTTDSLRVESQEPVMENAGNGLEE